MGDRLISAALFEDELIPPLVRLTHKLLDAGLYGYLEPIGNLLVSCKSGTWRQLPDDEMLHWLEEMAGLFGVRALGDCWDHKDEDWIEVLNLIDSELKGLRRKLRDSKD